MHGEQRGDRNEIRMGNDGVGVGKGPLAGGGFDEIPEEVGFDELAVGSGAEEIEVPENHVGFVAIEGGRWPAAVVVPEKADEIEADLGTGKGAELFGHVGAEKRQPAGMARTVVRARRALAGRPEPFGGRERVSAWRWLRGGGLDEEQQNQRKGRFHVHIFKD